MTTADLDYLRRALVKLREAEELVAMFGRTELGGWSHQHCIYTAGALDGVIEEVEARINRCPECGESKTDGHTHCPECGGYIEDGQAHTEHER